MVARVVVTTSVALDVAENDLKRFTFIQCSNARVGDQAYFQALYAAIHDAGTISAVCKFLRHRPLWARVRARVRARAVVVYWLGLTEHLMAPGGAAEARDRMDYDLRHGLYVRVTRGARVRHRVTRVGMLFSGHVSAI